ncbi:MAG: hypothetical protein NUV59_02905 [Patescibacteria group bacterium]|nr:hypothetical protein [Patescibacteria group bacterium]
MSFITTALLGFFLLGNAAATSAIAATVAPAPTYSVAVTGYNAVPAQTDDDPFTTASGARSNPEVVVARSVDLADKLPYGTVIEVTPKAAISNNCGISLVGEHIGYRVVADSMHSRKRNQIDIMFDTSADVVVGRKATNAAIALGVCSDVEIRVVGQVDIKKMPRNQAELKKVVDEQLLAISK